VLRKQLAGDVLNLVAYRLRCKHYFCHLTRPPSCKRAQFPYHNTSMVFKESGEGMASVYCMIQILLRVKKPLSLTITVTVPAPDVQNSTAIVRKGVGGRSDSVELVPYVFSSRCVCYVHDAIYIFSCRVCRYDLCVRFL